MAGRIFDNRWTSENVVKYMRHQAEKGIQRRIDDTGPDKVTLDYCDSCNVRFVPGGVSMTLTRDDVNIPGIFRFRGWHFSLGFVTYGRHLPFDEDKAEYWVRLIFGDDFPQVKHAGPLTPIGEAKNIHHYFLDKEAR